MVNLIDRFGRIHNYLRISVTDNCNFRCFYCNPNSAKDCNTGKDSLLSFEEISRVINLFSSHFGFNKFRFTGGEPLVRKGFIDYLSDIQKLKNKLNFKVGLTTNGYLLSYYLPKIIDAGIDNINISLDTLDRIKFKQITKIDVFDNVLNSIYNTLDYGFDNLKINVVVMKGINDDEILDFVHFAITKNINIRFIEYMPFSDNDWNKEDFFSYFDMKSIIETKYKLIADNTNNNSVAKDFILSGYNGKISFISSISEHFCNSCNRVRIASNGDFRTCLFSDDKKSLNFKYLFKNGFDDNDIALKVIEMINDKWEKHPDEISLKKLKSNNMFMIGG
jgi:cyclic pyranopterin phosphate synthase